MKMCFLPNCVTFMVEVMLGQFCGWCTLESSIEALQTEAQEERSLISKSPQECAFPLTLPAGDA